MQNPPLPGPRDPRRLLERIAKRCVEDLEVEHVTISVATGGQAWSPAYSTTPVAERLDQYAYTAGEGPAFDVLRDHEPVLVSDVSAREIGIRWPAWASAAHDAGICSLATFPVHAGAITAGALSIYLTTPGGLHGQQYAHALRLTDLAFMGLLDLMAGLDGDGGGNGNEADDGERREVTELLRADVHRAAGMIMGQTDVPIDQALARLRAHAFSSGRSLSEVATDVVARRLRFEPEGRSAE